MKKLLLLLLFPAYITGQTREFRPDHQTFIEVNAGMGTEQFTMSPQATEYGAIVGQFPENTYYRLKTFLKHPDSQRQVLHPMFDMMGIETSVRSEPVREIAEILAFIDALTDNIQNARQQDKAIERLVHQV